MDDVRGRSCFGSVIDEIFPEIDPLLDDVRWFGDHGGEWCGKEILFLCWEMGSFVV